MAFLDVHFYSQSLGLQSSMSVILPQPDQRINVDRSIWDSDEPLPVLYLLHGMSDDHTTWLYKTSIDRYASGCRLAIVMPNCHRSNYVNQVSGLKYDEFISEELPEIVHHFFKISDKREETFIAGLSMGGYGAMKTALKYPERYGSVASMSGALDQAFMMRRREFDRFDDKEFMENLKASDPARYRLLHDYKYSFGSIEEFEKSDNNIMKLIDRDVKENRPIPRIHMSIGTEDFLYDANVTVRKKLDENNIEYVYTECPGVHEWKFWDARIQEVLDWLPIENQLKK